MNVPDFLICKEPSHFSFTCGDITEQIPVDISDPGGRRTLVVTIAALEPRLANRDGLRALMKAVGELAEGAPAAGPTADEVKRLIRQMAAGAAAAPENTPKPAKSWPRSGWANPFNTRGAA